MAEKKVIQKGIEVFVSRQFTNKNRNVGPEKNTEEVIEVRQFITEPAKVTVDRSLTLNLGNYESARLGVAVSIPCYLEEINDAYTYGLKWVEDKINEEKREIRDILRR